MRVKVLPLKNGDEFYDAVLSVDDKYIYDEIETMLDRMRSDKASRITNTFGPFRLDVQPRTKTYA